MLHSSKPTPQLQNLTCGRLAPSPTGVLHVGNARSLLLAWLSARSAHGRILLRIEDLLPDADVHLPGLLRDLAWLGVDWDPPQANDSWQAAPPVHVDGRAVIGLLRQSTRTPLYADLLARLHARGEAYPCLCTRKDIDGAARAPHAEDRGTPYPGTCRGRYASEAEALAVELQRAEREGRPPLGVAWRLRVPDAPVHFDDRLLGLQAVDLPADSGDVVVRRKDGGFAYMFAVVVDDLAMGVTEVVRGDDLLGATGQQLAVYAALSRIQARPGDPLADLLERARVQPPPHHAHVPLVLGDDGRRLAKRNRSLHLHDLRQAGVEPGQLRRWLAVSCGLPETDDLGEMVAAFAWDRLPRRPVRFGEIERQDLLVGLQKPL